MGRVTKNLKTGKVHVDTDLDTNELAVIGRVTVLWGRLEHLLLLVTLGLADSADTSIADRAIDDVFTTRLRAFFEAVSSVTDEAERSMLLQIHSKVDNLRS